MEQLRRGEGTPWAPQMFGNAGRDHMDKYGSTPEHFAWIGWKNHQHSTKNPYAQFQRAYSLREIQDAPEVHAPLTKLQCSPTSDGAACAVIASERFVDRHGLGERAVEIVGQAMVTDLPSTFDEQADCMTIVGYDMSCEAAQQAYNEAGLDAAEVDVIELHDCFSTNELITYEALGLCERGRGHELGEAGSTTYGGKWVVNPHRRHADAHAPAGDQLHRSQDRGRQVKARGDALPQAPPDPRDLPDDGAVADVDWGADLDIGARHSRIRLGCKRSESSPASSRQ
jgi:sterol carrier protein 2